RMPIPPDRWAFGRCPAGKASLVASPIDICYFDRFQGNKIYELIYTAKNPVVMGLGHAATRDIAAFLKYEEQDDAGHLNPLRSAGAPSSRLAGATGAWANGG